MFILNHIELELCMVFITFLDMILYFYMLLIMF